MRTSNNLSSHSIMNIGKIVEVIVREVFRLYMWYWKITSLSIIVSKVRTFYDK